MAKRPTPKKRRPKHAGRTQHSEFMNKEIRQLTNRQNSPYGAPAEPKNKADKALEKITRIAA